MSSTYSDFICAVDPNIIDEIEIHPRAQRRLPLPVVYQGGALADWFTRLGGSAEDLWRHQSQALEHLAEGRDTALMTGTASGKTLPMMTNAFRIWMSNRRTSIVVLPSKALLRDQFGRWKSAFEAAGLSGAVGMIHGEVKNPKRLAVVQGCKVILATVDTVQSWLLSNLGLPAVNQFLAALGFISIDECHAMAGVLGSNAAFIIRRLELACRNARAATKSLPFRIQYGAASATMCNPAEHLHALTGREFSIVEDCDNGAPLHGSRLIHLEGPTHGEAGEKVLGEIAKVLAEQPGKFIVFADGRQVAERIAAAADHDRVLPYRGGYEAVDRVAIENALRDGNLAGIISTSAFELGIDIPGITTVVNFGVPPTRSSFKQRAGRTGRHQPGLVFVMAPVNAFVKRGTTFRDFCTGPVESVSLYIENKAIQFQNALCLWGESGLPSQAKLEVTTAWPPGFAEAVDLARPGSLLPPELVGIARLARGKPHAAFPARMIAGPRYDVRDVGRPDQVLETMTERQAFIECYPGAIFRHKGKPFRVLRVDKTAFRNTVWIQAFSTSAKTSPIFSRSVSVSEKSPHIIDDNFRLGTHGALMETAVQITETISGYSIFGNRTFYGEGGSKSFSDTASIRSFETTGIVVRIFDDRFVGNGKASVALRECVAKTLCHMLVQIEAVSPQDVDCAWEGIASSGHHSARPLDDAIVIFDTVEGGLRLSAPLFKEIGRYLEIVGRSLDVADQAGELEPDIHKLLTTWRESLTDAQVTAKNEWPTMTGERIILAHGSHVLIDHGKRTISCRLGDHEFVQIDGHITSCYRCYNDNSVALLVPAERVKTFGSDWRHVILDESTGQVREIAA